MLPDLSRTQLITGLPCDYLNNRSAFDVVSRTRSHLNESGGAVIILYRNPKRSTIAKAIQLVLDSFQLRRAKKALRRKFKGSIIKTFGIFPSVEQPAVIFELSGNSAEYAKLNILPSPDNNPLSKVAIEWLTGIPTSTAATAIMVLGVSNADSA